MSERTAKIKDAIETMHGCEATHVASKPGTKLFQGQAAWDGVVETFELTGHPKAKRCHAWMYEEKGVPQYTTILELPTVDFAKTAVKDGHRAGPQMKKSTAYRIVHVTACVSTAVTVAGMILYLTRTSLAFPLIAVFCPYAATRAAKWFADTLIGADQEATPRAERA